MTTPLDMKAAKFYGTITVTLCVLSLTFYTQHFILISACSKGDQTGKNLFVPASAVLSFKDGSLQEKDQDQLLAYIRHHIRGPSVKPLQLSNPESKYFSQAHQDEFVDKLLHQKREGFFVECGAANGEKFSNTLFFERERNWTGLLIEANPALDNILLQKHRKAYSINACLSVTKTPKVMKFRPVGLLGGLDGTMDSTHMRAVQNSVAYKQEIDIQCFPLSDIMKAINRNHIHFLSLDVEGPELDILKTIDWEKMRIDVMAIEYRLYDGKQNNRTGGIVKLNKLREFILGTELYQETAILAEKGQVEEQQGLDVIFQRLDTINNF